MLGGWGVAAGREQGIGHEWGEDFSATAHIAYLVCLVAELFFCYLFSPVKKLTQINSSLAQIKFILIHASGLK